MTRAVFMMCRAGHGSCRCKSGTVPLYSAFLIIRSAGIHHNLISTICSVFLLHYPLYADNEPSAEVYGAAADRQQASIVFDVAKRMVEKAPALLKRSKIAAATKRIVNYRINIQSYYKNIMHDKFCIIDLATVVHGTFNWTNAANYNRETISIDKRGFWHMCENPIASH